MCVCVYLRVRAVAPNVMRAYISVLFVQLVTRCIPACARVGGGTGVGCEGARIIQSFTAVCF